MLENDGTANDIIIQSTKIEQVKIHGKNIKSKIDIEVKENQDLKKAVEIAQHELAELMKENELYKDDIIGLVNSRFIWIPNFDLFKFLLGKVGK